MKLFSKDSINDHTTISSSIFAVIFILHIIILIAYESLLTKHELILYIISMISICFDAASILLVLEYILNNIDSVCYYYHLIVLIIKLVLTAISFVLLFSNFHMQLLLPLIYNLIISLSLIVGLAVCLFKNKLGDDKLATLL